ncbi:MAG: hypothetical protein L0220_09595 [Acidobacteria bacterium]|nr:hypothetical protein [Acidobacteriota bacterium]
MNGSYDERRESYGLLMNRLLGERDCSASDEEFRAYAMKEVRKFIVELRELDIELTLRPNYLDVSPSHYSSSEKLES